MKAANSTFASTGAFDMAMILRIGTAVATGGLVGLLLLNFAAPFASIFDDDDGRYDVGVGFVAPERVQHYLENGVAARRDGDFETAVMWFHAASGEIIFEFPNYQYWADISELYCASGNIAAGTAMLEEFACAVDLMGAQKECYLQDPYVPNPDVSPLCYATLCNPLYSTYFGQNGQFDLAREQHERDLQVVSQLRNVCGVTGSPQPPR
jgi:hypothetical protein